MGLIKNDIFKILTHHVKPIKSKPMTSNFSKTKVVSVFRIILVSIFILWFDSAYSSEITSLAISITNSNNSQIKIYVRKPFKDEYYNIEGQNGLFSLILNNPDSISDCKIVYSNYKIDLHVIKGEKVSVSFNNADLVNSLKIISNISGPEEYETFYNKNSNTPKLYTEKMALLHSPNDWKSLDSSLLKISNNEIEQLNFYKTKLSKRLYDKYYADIIYLNFDIALSSELVNNQPRYLDSVMLEMKSFYGLPQVGIINEQALSVSANYRSFLRDYFYQYSTIELNRLKELHSFNNMSYSSRLYALTDFMFDDDKIRDWIKTKLLSDLLDFQPLSEVEPYFSKFMVEDSVVDYKEYLLKIHEDLTKDMNSEFMNKITLIDNKGQQVTLSNYVGKKIYIDFWASWCGWCLDEMTNHLPAINNQFKDNNVIVVSISIDEKESDWKKAVGKYNFKGVQLYAGNSLSKLKDYFHLYSLPQYCILDENGKLVTGAAPRPSELENDKRLFQTLFEKKQ